MARSRATRGNNAQFTYDFGIAIAQSTVNKMVKLTGASLTLASAFYALKTSATEYVEVLRENTLRFGGVLSTMRAMEQAQNRLIKGQSYFTVDDQLKGMNQLMAVSVDVGENLDWINKAAHATGRSYAEFSGMIASAIQGNSQALVDAGLMTQRATRMFDKYAANTVMRQRAILDFVKSHKGLLNAIKNDFETIQDQTNRIRANWSAFLKSIVGKPNDPNSFYGQIVKSMRDVATSLSRNSELIKKYGFIIGQTLGWVIRQIGHFVVWLGGQIKKSMQDVFMVTDNFQQQASSLLVWLEFWKLKVVDFFNSYGGAIKGILKLLIAFKAMKAVFVISDLAYMSVIRYRRAIRGLLILQQKYLLLMGPYLGNRFSRWLQSLAVFMPRWLRRVWVAVGKFFERGIFGGAFKSFFKGILPFFAKLFGSIKKGFLFIFGLFKNLPAILKAALRIGKLIFAVFKGSNPIGWIVLAISFFVTLYRKVEGFRELVKNFFRTYFELSKLAWNSIMWIYVQIRIGLIKLGRWFKTYVWTPIKNFFTDVGGWISDMWKKFMNTSVGKWINKWVIQPIKDLFDYIADFWKNLVSTSKKLVSWLRGTNESLANSIQEDASKYGISVKTFGESPKEVSTGPQVPYPVPPTENTVSNPIIEAEKTVAPSTSGDNYYSEPSSMVFNDGSIKIVVQKGENIDERKLAQKIKEVILDLQRNGNIRGGNV